MLLPDKTGISCDACNAKCQFVFTYYSADFLEQSMVDGIRQGLPVKVKSFDWCPACFKKFSNLAITNYRPTRLVSCDWCGRSIANKIYSTNVAEAKINIEVNPKTQSTIANNTITENLLDMISCTECYTRLSRGII